MAYDQATYDAHATGHDAASPAHQPETTVNSPVATISAPTHTVPPMHASCPASVSFFVSMRSSWPGVTGLRTLKRFTAASSAVSPALFSRPGGAADPSIAPAV